MQTISVHTLKYLNIPPAQTFVDANMYISYLGVPTGGDHLEADISESVEDDHRVGANTAPVTWLLGRSTAGVAGSSGAVELGLTVGRVSSRGIKLNIM